jgi:hypothetical protein
VNGWSTRPSLSTSALELSSLSVTSKALDPATPSFTVPLSFSCLSLTLLLFRFLSQRKVSYESLNGLGFLNQILIQFFFFLTYLRKEIMITEFEFLEYILFSNRSSKESNCL